MPDNENVTTADTPGSIGEIGIPQITMELNASSVIPNAVDPTLQNSGEAADAAAVGLRFDTVEDNVSAITYDIYGTDESDPECLRIEQRLEAVEGSMVSQDDIDTTLSVAGKVAGAKATGDAIGALNGNTLKYADTGNDTIKYTVDGIDTRVTTLEGKTANDIPYVANGDSIKDTVDDIREHQPFLITFEESDSALATVLDSRITAQHIVASTMAQHPKDVQWKTETGKVTLECDMGIPAMTLVLCLPE